MEQLFKVTDLEQRGHGGRGAAHAPAPRSWSACQQATRWPGRCSVRGGAADRHSAVAIAQRGAKVWRPAGRLLSRVLARTRLDRSVVRFPSVNLLAVARKTV